MESRATAYLLWVLLLIPLIAPAQDVLFDDVGTECPRAWPPPLCGFGDTLANHGVTVHLISEEGWTNLMYMDALLFLWRHPWRVFDPDTKAVIIEFARNGGKIVIWTCADTFPQSINGLLADPAWQPTLQIGDTLYDYASDTLHLKEFSPFTDNVGYFALALPTEVLYGEHAYPFGYSGPNFYYPNVAISYPFLHESNCSSYIVVVTGTAMWRPSLFSAGEEIRFASNILLTAAGVSGYELPPGAIPGGGFAAGCGGIEDTTSECFAHPLPFTPNSDGINDYAKFEYPGMHRNGGVVFIYTLENEFVREVRNGDIYDSPKGVIYWDGKDGYGRLMENGVYLYIVQDGGKTVCKGTVYLAR